MNRVANRIEKRFRSLAVAALISFAATAVWGQTPAPAASSPASTEFEVASIKPSAPGGRGIQVQISPGARYIAKNVTAKFLIQQAFGVRDFQISGGASWIGSERFDISAKADGATTQEQLKPLLQALLAERFKLTFHRETKEMVGYALVVGKNGPKLKESAPSEGGPQGPQGGRGQMRMGRGQISGQGMPVALIATQLSQQMGRSVIDKTGLKGNYDFTLEWTPDEQAPTGPREIGTDTAPPVDSAGPSIFTAVQEQLGLKLEGQKGPVELILIDGIEKPTEN